MSGVPALCSFSTGDATPPVAAVAPSPSAHASFLNFFAHTRRSGLTIIQQYEAGSLLEYAEQAHVLEQKLVTGCYLLQAVLLVEYFMRTNEGGGSSQRAQDFGLCTPCTEASSAGEGGGSALVVDCSCASAPTPFCAAVRSFYVARCQPHGSNGSLTAHQQDEIGWRAIFAVQLHSVMEAPEFPAVRAPHASHTQAHGRPFSNTSSFSVHSCVIVSLSQLQSMLLRTCLTTLRTLRRVWHPQHISFFTKGGACAQCMRTMRAVGE